MGAKLTHLLESCFAYAKPVVDTCNKLIPEVNKLEKAIKTAGKYADQASAARKAQKVEESKKAWQQLLTQKKKCKAMADKLDGALPKLENNHKKLVNFRDELKAHIKKREQKSLFRTKECTKLAKQMEKQFTDIATQCSATKMRIEECWLTCHRWQH